MSVFIYSDNTFYLPQPRMCYHYTWIDLHIVLANVCHTVKLPIYSGWIIWVAISAASMRAHNQLPISCRVQNRLHFVTLHARRTMHRTPNFAINADEFNDRAEQEARQRHAESIVGAQSIQFHLLRSPCHLPFAPFFVYSPRYIDLPYVANGWYSNTIHLDACSLNHDRMRSIPELLFWLGRLFVHSISAYIDTIFIFILMGYHIAGE